MASTDLKDPVVIQPSRLDATVLPPGFSPAFTLYLIQQGLDFTNVAGKANDAGQGAYDAQIKNEEQDIELEDHEQRIALAEQTLQNHEQRLQAAESELQNHELRIAQNEQDISSLGSRVAAVESDISELQLDYVSKSATTPQSLSSSLNATTSYSVNGTKVVGERVTGFSAATGTALMGAFNANITFSASTTYTQSEAQAMATALTATRQRIKALEDAMRTHGLID